MTGQQTYASYLSVSQEYDGDGLRVKKTENGTTTCYLRSTILGGQVVAEITWNGSSWQWKRGFVFAGNNLLAVQQDGAVYWMHEDPITKSKQVTNIYGSVVSTIELDPWGADTNRSSSPAFQPKKFTSYHRDDNGTDEAMFRRYNRWHSRFDQPDPHEGSYDLTDPQSFNRYAYVQNDPTNFTDPTGRVMSEFCGAEYSFTACGGNGGFWGGDFGGHVAEYNREYGGLPPNIASALGDHNERLQNTFDAIAATRAARNGDWAAVYALMQANPTLVLQYVAAVGDPAQNGNQLKQFAEQLVNNIPGSRLETRNGQYVVVFSGSYEEVVSQLKKAGYQSGVLPPYNNPLDHSGGKEFRTTGTPGFHFMVLYPQYKIVWGPPQNRGELTPYYVRLPGPTMAVHLHIDPNNPASGVGGFLRHAIDFILRR